MELIYKHGQERHFKIIRYPDGQQNVELDLSYFNNPKDPIEILCSIRNFGELEVLLSLVAALRKNDFYIKNIDFKYLFGMRSDRAFAAGQPNYFRDVIAPVINQLSVSVSVLHPHSKISLNALNGGDYYFSSVHDRVECCFSLGGDASACCCDTDYAYDDQEHFFLKKRTDHGVEVTLQKRTIESIKADPEKPIVIYDDLCDGGATFIAEAKYLRDNKIILPDRRLYLFVTHGLFSKGLDELFQYFNRVYTTNSYQEYAPHEKLTVVDVWTS